MKTDKNHIEDEVRKTMLSLDGMAQAGPRPFFYSRLTARMERNAESSSISLELAPVYRRVIMGVLAFLITANVITVTLMMGEKTISETTVTQESEFFDQYYMPVTTIDNLETQLTQ